MVGRMRGLEPGPGALGDWPCFLVPPQGVPSDSAWPLRRWHRESEPREAEPVPSPKLESPGTRSQLGRDPSREGGRVVGIWAQRDGMLWASGSHGIRHRV